MEKIQIKPHSCIHGGKVQCVVKLSGGGVVCGVGGVVIVKVSTTQLQLRPRLRPATAPRLVLPEGGRGGGGANIHDIPSSCCWALAGPG